jgi:MFS family permease
MFTEHNPTIKGILTSEVFFGTALGWFGIYRSLYMVSLGVTEVQVGMLSALTLSSQVVGALLGGYTADRFGRKRSMQFFDGLGWLTAVLLWIVARNLWYFVIAALINGLFMGAIPSWNCLIVENTTKDRRASVYGLIHLMFLGSGLFTPVAGAIVGRYGMITGNRVVYSLGFLIILTALSIRQRFVHEAVNEVRPVSAVSGLAGFSHTIKFMLGSGVVLTLVVSRLLSMFSVVVWNAYSGLYMTNSTGLGLAPQTISVLPVVNSFSMFLVMLLVVPTVREKYQAWYLCVASTMIVVGYVLFLSIPAGVFWPLIVFALLSAGGSAIFEPVRSAYLANEVPAESFARVVSLAATLMLLGMIPAGPLAGWLFAMNVRYPFYLLLGVHGVNILLMVSLVARNRSVGMVSKIEA